MSGSLLAEQAQEVPSQLPSSDPPTEDTAASLRAAALLTLRSKKRKVATNGSEPRLPPRAAVAPPSIELDYGSEAAAGSSSVATPSIPAPIPSAPVKSEPMEVDRSLSREEGEISDSEDPPVSLPPPPEPSTPRLKQVQPIAPQMLPLSLPIPKVEPMSPALGLAAPSQPSVLPTAPSPQSVDENHVRPGLPRESDGAPLVGII